MKSRTDSKSFFCRSIMMALVACLTVSTVAAQNNNYDCERNDNALYSVTFGTNGTDGRSYDAANDVTTFSYTVSGLNYTQCGKLKRLMFEIPCFSADEISAEPINIPGGSWLDESPEYFLDNPDDFFGFLGVRWYGSDGAPHAPILVDYNTSVVFTISVKGNVPTGMIRYGHARFYNGFHSIIGTTSGPACEYCGDGVLQSQTGESCDDGNSESNDGCNESCELEFCGDGTKQSGEECDDGNKNSDDGCDFQCMNEFCGDGVKQANESCDDGNTNDGDGCNSSCETEVTPQETATPQPTPTAVPTTTPNPNATATPTAVVPTDCKDFDFTDDQRILDGGVKRQERAIRAALRLLGTLDSNNTLKKFRKRVRSSAHELQVDGWVLSWSIPGQGTYCEVAPQNCIQSSENALVIEEYLEKSTALNKLMGQTLRKLRRYNADPVAVQNLKRRQQRQFKKNKKVAATVPGISTVCM